MSEDTNKSFSLIDIGDLSKPADTLIKKISKGIGAIFEPSQIRRVAKAEADAAMTAAETELKITDLHRRAMIRFVEEEAQKQRNIEEITAQALPHLNKDSDADSVEDDWITNFFDKSRLVSDQEMQSLWASILAGEVNNPGAFSKRTVNFLSSLDKLDAHLFTQLCGFLWNFGYFEILMFNHRDDIYKKNGVTFDALLHLESIGLIQFNHVSGYHKINLPSQFKLDYYGRVIIMNMPEKVGGKLNIGEVMLTKLGQELAPICGSEPVNGFFEYVLDKWSDHEPLIV